MKKKVIMKAVFALGVLCTVGFANAAPASFSDTLTGYTGNTTIPATVTALAANGLDVRSIGGWEIINFDGTGAEFGTGHGGDEGRNLLRTTEADYDSVSFDAYITVQNSTSPRIVYIGIGAGAGGSWYQPDVGLAGVDTVFLAINNWSASTVVQNDGVATTTYLSPDPGHGDGTHRIRLAYDSVAHTVSFDLDKNYMGGAFVADTALGSVSTSALWSGSELGKIYVGGDDGVLLTDFDVVIPEGTLIVIN